jgi:hypothetical protein
MTFMLFQGLDCSCKERANGSRYPLVGGTRQRHFDGTNFKPRQLPENAQTPTSRVHAVLAGILAMETHYLSHVTFARQFVGHVPL